MEGASARVRGGRMVLVERDGSNIVAIPKITIVHNVGTEAATTS